MKDDAVLAELREVRRKIVDACGSTEEGRYRHTLEVQRRYADRLGVPAPERQAKPKVTRQVPRLTDPV